MEKTLIVITHPDIQNSVINKRWIEELEKYPHHFTLHELYKKYPSHEISVTEEQALLEQYETIVLQFPIYWFNCPPLLKQWLDQVFSHGWAYGSQGNKLENRKIALAVTAGGDQTEDYGYQGKYQYPLVDVLRPFEMTVNYVKANYHSYFSYYGAEHQQNDQNLDQNAFDYVDFLFQLAKS